MAGENLHDGIMEVAFEQWTKRAKASVGFNVFPTLQGSNIGEILYWQRARTLSLNLGGNTDLLYSP